MRRALIGLSAALGLAGLLAACKSGPSGSPTRSLPPVLPAGAAGFSGLEMQQARDLYAAKCANCHRFYPPADYSANEWRGWMQKMSRKSRLKPDEELLLNRYLGAFRLPEPAATDRRP